MTILTFNRSISTIVSKELHADLTDIRNTLPKNSSWELSIADRFEKLCRIAKTSQLRGVEKVLYHISIAAKKLVTPNDSLSDATGKLLQSLITHLSELVNEHKNTPMKMYKPLQSVQQLLNINLSPVLTAEMFMPYTPEDVNGHRPYVISPDELINAISDYKNAYQMGLISVIKDQDLTKIGSLRQALISIEPKNPHLGYRVFFESAIAIMDIISKTGELDNIAKWVLSKIDSELNDFGKGFTKANDDLLSAMLYLIARGDENISLRVKKLQENYNLKSYLTDLNGLDPAVIEKFSQVLVKSRDVWSQYAASEPTRVAKLISELQSKSNLLKNQGFTTVINALHDVINEVTKNPSAVDSDNLSIEGAGALLVLEQQLRDGSNINSANLAANRLYQLIGKSIAYTTDTSQPQTASATLHVLAGQIQEDLTQLEPRLLEILNDQNDGESELRNGLKKISRILNIFGNDNALSQAFALFEREMLQDLTDKADLVTKYTQLTSLMDPLKTSDKNAISAAQKWINSQVKTENSSENSENKDIPNDPEMLDIFLEEASGIIVDLEKWFTTLNSDHTMTDLIANMRRGFHTLKGSGRMVGLTRFGDLSYISELLLSNWMTSKKMATPELLDYVQKSMDAVKIHIADFKNKGYSFVEFEHLEKEALALGGTTLGDAPQKKTSVKLTKPVVKEQTHDTIPVTTNVVKESIPIELDIVPEFKFETPDVQETKEETFELPTFDVSSFNEPITKEPELKFEELKTTTQGLPLVPNLPELPVKIDSVPDTKPLPEFSLEDKPLVLQTEIKSTPDNLPDFKLENQPVKGPNKEVQKAVEKTEPKKNVQKEPPANWNKSAKPEPKAQASKGTVPSKKQPVKQEPKKKGFLAWLLGLFGK